MAGHLPQLKITYQLSSCFFRNGKSPKWSETSHPRHGPSPSEPSPIRQDPKLVAICDTDPSLVPLRVALVFVFLGYLRISNLAPPTAQSFDPARRQALEAGASVRPQVDKNTPDPEGSHHHSTSSFGGQPHLPCRHLDPLPPYAAMDHPGQDHTASAHHRFTSREDHFCLHPQSHVPQGDESSRFVRQALYPPQPSARGGVFLFSGRSPS